MKTTDLSGEGEQGEALRALLSIINGKRCPWRDFIGDPGSRYYAETVAQWLSTEFAPEKYMAAESAGWWYAELAPSVVDGNATVEHAGVSSQDPPPSSTVAGAQEKGEIIKNVAREIVDCLEDENLKLNKQEWVNLVALMIAGKTEADVNAGDATRQKERQ